MANIPSNERVQQRRQELRGLATGNIKHVAGWQQICAAADASEDRWIAQLRLIGIKAAHPDDGWVDRKSSATHDFVQFQYPQFDDGPQVGDLIALGHVDRYRVRKVLGVKPKTWVTWFSGPRYVVVK